MFEKEGRVATRIKHLDKNATRKMREEEREKRTRVNAPSSHPATKSCGPTHRAQTSSAPAAAVNHRKFELHQQNFAEMLRFLRARAVYADGMQDEVHSTASLCITAGPAHSLSLSSSHVLCLDPPPSPSDHHGKIWMTQKTRRATGKAFDWDRPRLTNERGY